MKTKPSSQPRTLHSQLLALAAGTLLAAAPLTVLAAAGDLDTTFDGDGVVTTTIGTFAIAYGVAIQPNGRIVAVGYTDNGPEYDFAVARYNSTGSLDSGFGVGGVVSTSFTTTGDYAYGVVIQSDGKIVVAGNAYNTNLPDFAVARYNSNGSLDTSFDTDGKDTTAFGADDIGRAVALQTDGKIVIAGYTNASGNDDFAVLRYNSNGSLDTSFDTDGRVTTAFTSNDDQARAVLIQPDGKIVAAGYRFGGNLPDFAVARYNSNGSLDTSFSGDGLASKAFGGDDYAYAAARQSDGKIVLAGCTNASGNDNVALTRFNSDGTLDTTFGTSGEVITAVHASNYDCAYGVAIQSDGKIVVTGYYGTGGFLAVAIFVARYNSNGTLDTGFGSGGIVTTSLTGSDLGLAVAIQSDGKIVVAGGSLVSASFVLLRYEGATAAPPPPPATTLPVPVGANTYACEAVPTNPVVSATPASAKPMGVSNPAPTDVRVTLQTAAFAAAVDVYVTARLADGSTVIRTPTGWFPYPATTTPLFAIQTAAIDMTSAANNLYASPLSALPPGNYQGNVIVVPTGAGIGSAAFYNWCYTKTF